MSLRRAIVEADPAELNVAEFCRTHGVSTWFFWDLRRRYAVEGDAVLEPKSRAPHRPANRTPADIEDAIVAARKHLVEAGWDAGPASIRFHLRHLDAVPSESTIWRILHARGQITPQPAKRPKSTRSFTAERANECWALDDTSWQLADGTEVKILNLLDDHSRLCVASVARTGRWSGPATFQVMAHAASVVGWPARFWSDNATAFTQILARAVEPIGVVASHTRPYQPNSNGKVERFHQTVKRWLTKQPAAATIVELQHQLDEFQHRYNTERPHRALRRRTPADVWAAAPKTGPDIRPVDTTTHVHDTVVHNGRSYAGRYAIAIGNRWNTQRALTVITGLTAHVFIDGHLIRQLTLDPTRRIQPLTERKAPRHA